jgi:hypothetical protein
MTEGSIPAAMPGGSALKNGPRLFNEGIPDTAFKSGKIAHKTLAKQAHCPNA